jgi:hypothetical protein
MFDHELSLASPSKEGIKNRLDDVAGRDSAGEPFAQPCSGQGAKPVSVSPVECIGGRLITGPPTFDQRFS